LTLGVKPKNRFPSWNGLVLTLPLELDEYAPFSRSWYDFSRPTPKEHWNPNTPMPGIFGLNKKSILEQLSV